MFCIVSISSVQINNTALLTPMLVPITSLMERKKELEIVVLAIDFTSES